MSIPEAWKSTQAMSANGLAEALGIAARSAQRIARCGLVGEVWEDRKTMLFRADMAQQIIDLPTPDPATLPSAIIVKMGDPIVDDSDDPRGYLGYHAQMTPNAKKDAISRWWRIGRAEDYTGQLLVATVGGVVAEVYRIQSSEWLSSYGRTKFETTNAEGTDAEKWRGIRLTGGTTTTVEKHKLS